MKNSYARRYKTPLWGYVAVYPNPKPRLERLRDARVRAAQDRHQVRPLLPLSEAPRGGPLEDLVHTRCAEREGERGPRGRWSEPSVLLTRPYCCYTVTRYFPVISTLFSRAFLIDRTPARCRHKTTTHAARDTTHRPSALTPQRGGREERECIYDHAFAILVRSSLGWFIWAGVILELFGPGARPGWRRIELL